MESTLSKLADKNFVVGFFLPALLFFAALKATYPCPDWAATICSAVSNDLFKNLTVYAIVIWVVAVLLVAANYSLYRFFEGYHLPSSLERWLKLQAQAQDQALLDLENRLFDEKKPDGTLKSIGERDAQREEGSVIRWLRLMKYPDDPARVLPTPFGNAIRAFELYPGEMYGASSIALWPLLQSVLPKEVAQRIDDAHAQVDLFLNGCVLASIFVVTTIARAFWFFGHVFWEGRDSSVHAQQSLVDAGPNLGWSFTLMIASMLVAWGCYVWSIGRIVGWGSTVKSAFDCYLPNLAEQLGYTLPASHAAREAFWRKVNKQIFYRDKFVADEYWSGARHETTIGPQDAPVAADTNAAEKADNIAE